MNTKKRNEEKDKDIAWGRQSMFTKLIEVEKIHLSATDYEITYYQNTNLNGTIRFTSEVEIGRNGLNRLIQARNDEEQ